MHLKKKKHILENKHFLFLLFSFFYQFDTLQVTFINIIITFVCVQAIFEILTSEYSYQHSLSILVTHFKDSADLKKTMTTTEHHHLFSNISVIQDVSKRYKLSLIL